MTKLGVRKCIGAFAAHTQLSLAFLHNILQKWLIIRFIDFVKVLGLWQSLWCKSDF